MREDGSVIEGLNAAGSNSTSTMSRTYPGTGSTIGPATMFGLRAARHMARPPGATSVEVRAARVTAASSS